MTLVKITGAASYPVTVAELKANARIDGTDEDATVLPVLIAAATAHAERLTGRAFAEQTWELVLDDFPAEEIEIDLGPVVSVTSVKYLDGDGVEQTMDAADYIVDTAADTGRILAPDGWPTAQADTINAVRVRFVTGGTPDDDVKQAILLLATHWYDRRAASGAASEATELPFAVSALLGLHRRMFV